MSNEQHDSEIMAARCAAEENIAKCNDEIVQTLESTYFLQFNSVTWKCLELLIDFDHTFAQK